ncbi:hypothetical protein C8R45DRAFT_880159 [Mycena sanguinolenta]|nr:hypothetical protein C8R45DRAFT_880159 [Mycena sanguinolenta]
MNRRPGSDTSSPFLTVPSPSIAFARVSSFLSPEFEVLLYSANVRMESTSWASSRSIPIYGDHDVVRGRIILGSNCVSGRVILNISGTFLTMQQDDAGRTGKHKHIFFSESETIDVTSDSDTPRKLVRQSRQSRAASGVVDAETRAFPFTFNLARDRQPGEILPTTTDSKSSAIEVTYKVTAAWEPLKLTQKPALLVFPIIVQPQDLNSMDDNSWIEMPLKCQRPVPVHCAVTLPKSLTFPRASFIPFFVVFTTTPRSSSLAREIAGDATITISVSSEICVLEESNPPNPITRTVSNESTNSDSRFSRLTSSVFKGLKSKSSSASLQSVSRSTPTTPLPRVSRRKAFFETQTVHHGISIGFPKRPRQVSSGGKAHPSLEEVQLLPDGLYKDKIPLGRNLLTSFNWGGVSVKYYFEVSVLLGQDELTAKILLRIT